MDPKDEGLEKKDEPDEPLENQPLAWTDEDRIIEDRKGSELDHWLQAEEEIQRAEGQAVGRS